MMNTDAAIVATSLTVARGGREVLHGIDVTIPRASVVGLLGPSGGGKSTFIRAVVGVQIVASGEVRVFGEPAGSPALRRRVGYVTQSPSVYGDLSRPRQRRLFRGDGRAARRPTSTEPSPAVDLTPSSLVSRVETNLSGGQRSRVSAGGGPGRLP
jgi:ABC-2 type transport system ATP-binding protein